MPTPEHESYLANLREYLHHQRFDPDALQQISTHKVAIAVLCALDLGVISPILESCYADTHRGTRPRDPLAMFRSLLVASLVRRSRINPFVAELRGSSLLRTLCGFTPEESTDPKHRCSPGVGTYYDFLARLHDGPRTAAEPPSEQERRRAATPRVPDSLLGREEKRAERPGGGVSAKLAEELLANKGRGNPRDFVERINDILWTAGVRRSASQDLLGDLDALILAGDGSPLTTAACGLGHRICDCGRHKKCACPRIMADPDARVGFDSYRKRFYFGYHLYEVSAVGGRADLPLHVRLDPANETDKISSILAMDRLCKRLGHEQLKAAYGVFDAGHDSGACHDFLRAHDIKPVIPLSGAVPAVHNRGGDTIELSKRAIPLCEAGTEMAAWGWNNRGTTQYLCPVKAGKLDRCPLAPDDEPDWMCGKATSTKWGPSVSIHVTANPRLFPEVPRNSRKYEKLYKMRTATERSNGRKKQRFDLEQCRHRRRSFWMIRLGGMALLQHAMAWLREVNVDGVLRWLLGHQDAPPEGLLA